MLFESTWYVKSSLLLFLAYLIYIIDILLGSIIAAFLNDNLIQIFYDSFPGRLFICILIKMIDTLFFYALYRTFRKIDFGIRRRNWLLLNIISLVFLSVTMVLVSLYPTQKLNNALTLLLILLSIGFFAMSLIVIYFFTEICYYFQNEKLAYHLQANYDNLTEQIAFQCQMKKRTDWIFHDWKNMISTSLRLIQNNNVSEATSLLEQIKLDLDGVKTGIEQRPGNNVINTVISYKSAICDSRGVKCSCEVETLPDISLSSLDMISLLLNLIDNAIDAAEKSLNPFIEINILRYKGYACFIVRNSHANQITLEGSVLKTTKLDKEMHGYGTRIISDIADRHNGRFTYEFDDQTFTATVLIPIQSVEQQPNRGVS